MKDKVIKLPPPQLDLDFPLMKALMLRRSKRRCSTETLDLQEISNILWSACGITMQPGKRRKSRRTAPSSSNAQEIRVYAALSDGVYLYEELEHCLQLRVEADVRRDIGRQKMMKDAPLGLIFVSDTSRLKGHLSVDELRMVFVSGTDTGFISQNIYLYCAAAGLRTCVLGLVDRDRLHDCMELEEHEKVVYTQVVGKELV